MNKALPLTALLLAVAFAGCTEAPEPPAPVVCDLPGHSVETVQRFDEELQDVVFEDQCLAIATVAMTGLPATSQAHFPIALTWTLTTDLEQSHSHNNGIRFSTESDPDYAGKVDGYGKEILGGKLEHRDFNNGDVATVAWTPETVGTLYVRAYAVSSAGNHWGPEMAIEITEVEFSGTDHPVSLSGGGLPGASTNPDDLTIELGDSVSWTSEDPGVTWTIKRTNGPMSFETTAGGNAVVFKVPGQYTYEAATEVGDVSGTINVNEPAL